MNKRVIIIRNAHSHDFGGGERFPVFLAEILKDESYKPLIISRSRKLLALANECGIETAKGWWWSRQVWSGWRNVLLPAYLIWQLILTVWYLAIFTSKRPAAVHIQGKDDFIAATLAGKLVGAVVVWTDHADLKHIWMNIRIWYKNPIGKLVYLMAKLADSITVVSESELKLVSKNLYKNDSILNKTNVIYNGIIDKSSDYKNIRNKSFTFCSVSRMVTDKGIREMIEAYDRFSKKHAESLLILIGDGPEEGKFRDLASSNRNIELLGYQSDPLKYIASCDIYLHATYHEGFSVSLVEASMLGRPVIATNVGGNIEIIQSGETGLLTPAKDTDALFNAMEKLYADRKLREKLGQNARKQYLEKFQFDQIVKKQFIPLYERNKK